MIAVLVALIFSGCNAENTIDSFEECKGAGYEVMYPDCIGCSPYCDIPSGERFEQESQRICVDRCGDGNCDEVVCMAEGCPCPETLENCPEDCR